MGWERVPGGAVRIAVDPKGNPWILNRAGSIAKWKNDKWQRMPGRARDIAVGAEGSVYAIGWNKYKGAYGIWKFNGVIWERESGYGHRIAVDPTGMPWVVIREGRIFRRTLRGWKLIKGRLDDIGIGPEGSVIGVRDEKGVWKYNEKTRFWHKIAKSGFNVAVGLSGRPYISTKKGTLFWPEKPCPVMTA